MGLCYAVEPKRLFVLDWPSAPLLGASSSRKFIEARVLGRYAKLSMLS